MSSLLNQFLKSDAKKSRSERKAALGIERLEAREVPALNVYLSYFDGYILNVDVPGAASARGEGGVAEVRMIGSDVQVMHKTSSEAAWTTTTFRRAALESPIMHVSFDGGRGNDRFTNFTALNCNAYGHNGADVFIGGSGRDALFGDGGNDILYGRGGDDRLNGGGDHDRLFGEAGQDVLEGMAGMDRLSGGSGADILRGGDHNDYLHGDSENDRLFGDGGFDYLYGDSGNDYMDAGSRFEVVVGGRGQDISAWHWTSDGAQPTDVIQGGAPSCWIVASIAAAARAGVNLPSRIAYLGNGRYSVQLFQYDDLRRGDTSSMHAVTQIVEFDGSTVGPDAPVTGDNRDLSDSHRAEFWALITQRAIVKALGGRIDTISPGNSLVALRMLTGRSGSWLNPASISPTRIMRNLSDRKLVTFCTGDTAGRLIGGHCYTVMRVFYDTASGQYCVTLRNPWGYDGDEVGDASPRDALVTLPWSVLASADASFAVS